jgi:iron complex outermembrane receptor protein
MMRVSVYGILCTVALLGLASDLGAQGSAALSGTVVDDLNGAPLAGAVVSIPGLDVRATTDASGQFLLDGIARGAHEVRFESHGYVGVVERILLTDAQFLQIRLDPVAAVLDEIMVLAGRAPSRPVVVRNVRTPDGDHPWQSALDLLEDQVPGVTVRRGGGLGNGAAILIRGVNSFRSDGAPLVIVDGVRLDGSQTGQNSFHTLDLIPAESVASIRVIKGAAEGTAYANAANGVILIETLRGDERNRPNPDRR